MNRVSALMKQTPESSTAPSAMGGYSGMMAVYQLRRGPSPDTESASPWIMDFPGSTTVRSKCPLFRSQPMYGVRS